MKLPKILPEISTPYANRGGQCPPRPPPPPMPMFPGHDTNPPNKSNDDVQVDWLDTPSYQKHPISLKFKTKRKTLRSISDLKRHLFQSNFLVLTKMLVKTQNVFSPNLNFLRHAVFKILQFKVNNFPLTSVLPFCQYYDGR